MEKLSVKMACEMGSGSYLSLRAINSRRQKLAKNKGLNRQSRQHGFFCQEAAWQTLFLNKSTTPEFTPE
jgi:hypothetical protein